MELFKDCKTINQKTRQEENLKELSLAIKESNLETFLFGGKIEENEKEHKAYHNQCNYKGLGSDRNTEKRMCRCMYYYNSSNEECLDCNYEWKWMLTNTDEFAVIDYERPTKYVFDKIGGVDLVIEDLKNKENYAVEVKPKGSKETIVRMISEILTYTSDENFKDKYVPAICFFKYRDEEQKEYSDQWKQLKQLEKNEDLKNILEMTGIEVFYILHEKDEFNESIKKFKINRYK